MTKFESVVLKIVIEIDGVETVIRQTDYTESMNDLAENDDTFTAKDAEESILEDIAIGESGIL